MREYPHGSIDDRKTLAGMSIARLLDLFFLQIRNLWRVDGLYFLCIEREFGTPAAAEMDAEVWRIMARIEAKSLMRMFNVGEDADVSTIIDLLQKSSWALDQPVKTVETADNKAVLSIDKCRTQEARLEKGLKEFPCKKVRFQYLKNFAQTLNPNVEVNCIVCPPQKHPPDVWCRWEFSLG